MTLRRTSEGHGNDAVIERAETVDPGPRRPTNPLPLKFLRTVCGLEGVTPPLTCAFDLLVIAD